MMGRNKWHRTMPFEQKNERNEIWTCVDSMGNQEKYHVQVKCGKPIDIFSLKLNLVEDFNKATIAIGGSRKKVFSDNSMLELVASCPICGAKESKQVLTIYSANYYQCGNCTHYYVKEKPGQRALEKLYSEDEYEQSTYTDKRMLDIRISQVFIPKIEWVIKCFEDVFGRRPKSILDIGAGSGHFVQACRHVGINADGIEISDAGRDFCKANFGFELKDLDFINQWDVGKDYDVITFWGVVEHYSYPVKMLNAAAMALGGREGLVVTEVPRWDCIGTVVQSKFSDTVVRHLEPLTHIQCFTDSSIATAYKECNLDIISAWYFGMDAFEIATQLSHRLGNNRFLEEFSSLVPDLQEKIDCRLLSDEVVLAGKPRI